MSDQNGSREAALVQLDSAPFATMGAVVLASERNLGNATGSRLHALSADGGRTFSREGGDSLPDVVTGNWTGVVCGLARADELLVFTAPAAAGARANLSLWTSRDAGASWGAPALSLWAGPAAYSDALRVNDTHVGVVFEGGLQEFAGGVWYVAVPLAAL